MEIEQKYRVDDDGLFLALLDLRELDDYMLHPAPEPEQQHNSYYDTADRRLRAARHGLRVRTIGEHRIATLKGEGTSVDGRSARGEWETPVDSDDVAGWPAGELRERVLAITGGAPLAPLLAIRTTRHNIRASRAGTEVALISLDNAEIAAGGRTQPIRELEIELHGEGTLADLDALCAALLARFSLQPERLSKLARGLALLEAAA